GASLPPATQPPPPPHLVHRVVGVLHDVELVIHDAASGNPLLQAQPERCPHVHAGRLDASPLAASQLRSEELVQRLLLSFLAEPQRLAGLQIAHYGKELVALSPVNLIYTHLPQRRFSPPFPPSLPIAQIHRPPRAFCPSAPPRPLSPPCSLTRLAHALLEPPAERRLAGQ